MAVHTRWPCTVTVDNEGALTSGVHRGRRVRVKREREGRKSSYFQWPQMCVLSGKFGKQNVPIHTRRVRVTRGRGTGWEWGAAVKYKRITRDKRRARARSPPPI